MSRVFPGAGTFAKIDGTYYQAFAFAASLDDRVTIATDDSSWCPVGEVSREQRGDTQLVSVRLEVVDQVVRVRLHGLHDGIPVYPLAPPKEGTMLVSPEHDDPQRAHEEGFEGDGRIGPLSKRIPAEEFVEIIEEVEVLYRRGVPPL